MEWKSLFEHLPYDGFVQSYARQGTVPGDLDFLCLPSFLPSFLPSSLPSLLILPWALQRDTVSRALKARRMPGVEKKKGKKGILEWEGSSR